MYLDSICLFSHFFAKASALNQKSIFQSFFVDSFLRDDFVQGCRPGFICNFEIGVWIICFLAKFEHNQKIPVCITVCRNVIQFPELNHGGFTWRLLLGDAKEGQSVIQILDLKTIALSRSTVEASLVITWSNRLSLW